jgi:hypothetical protein
MADEKPNQPSRAEQYRKRFFDAVGQEGREQVAALWAIAAELAEGNSRDREAEIRAKNAEAFVAGIQEELRKQGVIIPGGVAQVKPPRAR